MPFFKSTYLFVVALLLSSAQHNVLGQASTDVRDCQDYTGANTTSATCNDQPGIVCTGGCTGFVTATNCTRSQKINVLEAPITTEKCTLGFGKSSATMYICINEQFAFSCYGSTSGKAQCKGCGPVNSTTVPQTVTPSQNVTASTNATSPVSSANNSSTPASQGKANTTPATTTSGGSTAGSTTTDTSSTSSASTLGAHLSALLVVSLVPSSLLW